MDITRVLEVTRIEKIRGANQVQMTLTPQENDDGPWIEHVLTVDAQDERPTGTLFEVVTTFTEVT